MDNVATALEYLPSGANDASGHISPEFSRPESFSDPKFNLIPCEHKQVELRSPTGQKLC